MLDNAPFLFSAWGAVFSFGPLSFATNQGGSDQPNFVIDAHSMEAWPGLYKSTETDQGMFQNKRVGHQTNLMKSTWKVGLQLAEVVRERYLSWPEKAKGHGVLADFFSGTWSQGTKKLITLPLVGKPLNLDRKPPPPLQVAPQPLWFSDTVANLRKLKELPYHLVHSGRIEELKQDVLGKDQTQLGGG
ncbi:hypothetical protein J1605_008480 [Eschrichtius robustus]|uniref:Uncharacterized protein n=1 Tax=Eschrichtius robustus TaxID=9764 RepID=A0AB34GZS8_ESCRO|nr:hypothetical protein J1605_008480 [Eschrichtius robustus]